MQRNIVPTRRRGIVHELDDTGETVIFDDANRRLMVLNEFGAVVWHLVDGQRSVGELVDMIVEQVGAEPERVHEDISGFLDSLVEAGLVSLSSVP